MYHRDPFTLVVEVVSVVVEEPEQDPGGAQVLHDQIEVVVVGYHEQNQAVRT